MNAVKFLLTYRYSMIIHDLTLDFTKSYLLGYRSSLRDLSHLKGRADYRTADQMNQAARSGKQCIVEAVGQSATSKKGEIKLLGVAKASFEELLTDFEDFLRQNGFEMYAKDNPRVTRFRTLAFRLSNIRNLSVLGDLTEKPKLFGNPQEDANFLVTLCHQITYLLHRQIKAAEQRFITEGGYSENLFKKRLATR